MEKDKLAKVVVDLEARLKESKSRLEESELWVVSYPNFIRGPLFVGMRPLFDHLKMFNTHRCGIRKVPRCFGKKPVKNTKTGVYLAK